MTKDEYRPRVVDAILQKKLQGMGAVLIEGPKWCGKTTTAEQHANSVLYMDAPSSKQTNLTAASIRPELLLEGKTPRLIDEWQIAPQLWDAVRYTVDHRNAEGQFILTGSAVPLIGDEEKKLMHSGTGRISRLRMRPMSLWESGDSSGEISLKLMFDGVEQSAICDADLEYIAFLVCRGGWPRATFQEPEISLNRAMDYYDAVVNTDIQRVDGVLRNPDRTARIMRSYARLQGTQSPISAISADLRANENSTFDDRTLSAYLNALRLIFVVEDLPAWNPNLRSKSAIRTSDTRYFIDPSIAVAALGLGPQDLINDLNTFGFLFECMCIRDLRVFADALNGQIYHYRDKDGLECDAVIHLRNGVYGLIEVKLGGDKLIEEGAANLIKLSKKIDTTRMKEPSFMMVLTAVGNYAFKRPDGVYVVPISCLKD
jgi:predicted AAA+ superfamily ATPase